MKKILSLLIAALALTQSVRAELVTPERAAQSARGFLGMAGNPVRENIAPRRTAGRNGQADMPQYYIFNNPDGGWIIIAGDDRVNPVIGYSIEGSFSSTDMPDNLKWWMDGVAEYVDIVRNSDIVASASVKAAWAQITSGAPESDKKELITAKWDQNEPYNSMCPIVTGDNQRSVTGCVATAMSIIMQYNKWPAHGKGVIGGYTSSIGTYIPAFSIDEHYYDWDLMSDENMIQGNTSYMTSDQKYQVARLMYDCGVATEMSFRYSGSGTQTGLVPAVLKNNMSYSQSVSYITRSSYTLDSWFSILRNEIDNDRVVYYSGLDENGGHAFVCDGYDTGGSMVHINWGWGNNNANGYYTLDLIVPNRYGGYRFSDNQAAIIGIAPDTANVILDTKSAISCIAYNGFYGIEPITPTDMRSGAEVEFYIGWFVNEVDRDVTREFKVCLMDKDGNVRQEGWHTSIEFPASNGYFYANQTDKDVLLVDPALTDYFKLFYTDDDGEWIPMVGNHDILPDVEGIVCGVTPDPVIIVPENCVAGKNRMSLTLGFSHVISVKWSVNGTEFDGDEVTLVSGRNDIRADVEYIDGSSGFIVRTVFVE